ncbi:18S rRNA biogenesis protein RCL1, partial [Ochromonadaceae sp. CCMP2298]
THPLAIFCKNPVNIVLSGITNDELDISVDVLKTVTFPLLLNFNIWGITMKVRRRGAKPKGGGEVELLIPPVRGALNPLHVTDEGLVKRVRGTVFSTKVSPQIANRVISACREVLNHVLPDVFINTDTYKGKLGGDSPGYSVSLVAESTSGALLSVERTAVSRVGGVGGVGGGVELPEDIGREAAMMLLSEVQRGGVVDTVHQPLVLMLMVLTPEDVSKVRFGVLSPQAIMMLRLLREAFGVTFKIKED